MSASLLGTSSQRRTIGSAADCSTEAATKACLPERSRTKSRSSTTRPPAIAPVSAPGHPYVTVRAEKWPSHPSQLASADCQLPQTGDRRIQSSRSHRICWPHRCASSQPSARSMAHGSWSIHRPCRLPGTAACRPTHRCRLGEPIALPVQRDRIALRSPDRRTRVSKRLPTRLLAEDSGARWHPRNSHREPTRLVSSSRL
jgi:hypothetical protein